MWLSATIPQRNAATLCGLSNNAGIYHSRALISSVISQGVNSQCASYLCAFIAEVWAAHEMDGPLTCSDKQPGSINIPLSLALFFRGSKGISRLQDCTRCLTGNHADPHVGPPVAPFSEGLHVRRASGSIVSSQAPSAAGLSCVIRREWSNKRKGVNWGRLCDLRLKSSSFISSTRKEQPDIHIAYRPPPRSCIRLPLLFVTFDLRVFSFVLASFLHPSRWATLWRCGQKSTSDWTGECFPRQIRQEIGNVCKHVEMWEAERLRRGEARFFL